MEKQMEETGDYRQRLTDHLIQQLEAGTAPWLKPWQPSKDSAQLPFNPVTNKSYRGANSILLSVMATEKGYEDPRWCTYKQALEQGWQVRKGQKGTPIEYWKFSETQQAQDDYGNPVVDKEGKPVLVEVKLEKPQVFRAFVFNARQMDCVPELAIETKRTFAWVPEERAEAILNASVAIILHDQHDRAFYSPTKDEIHLPPRGAFSSASGYYATALHELGHWSGHESRLNRTFGANFGSPDYAKEELRAELASYFLSARLGLPHDPSHHAAYVKNWIVVLKDDKNEIFRASRDAEKITDFVMSLDRTKELDRSSEHSNTNEKEHPRERTILAVPFAEKDQAKVLGARWDKAPLPDSMRKLKSLAAVVFPSEGRKQAYGFLRGFTE
jgi:antirestriction protein ArdC